MGPSGSQPAYMAFFCLLALSACALPTIHPCTSFNLQRAPTPTRPQDPNLASEPNAHPSEHTETTCLPAVERAQHNQEPVRSLTATNISNLSLNPRDQTLLAAAVGDDMHAIAWQEAGTIFVGISRGGNHLQVRAVDTGERAAMTFSSANRLHLVYEQAGQLIYRAADQGIHPADVLSETVASGTHPTIVLDQFNYAHIVFEVSGRFHHAAQHKQAVWQIQPVTGARPGSALQLTTVAGTSDRTIVATYRGRTGEIHIDHWVTTPYGFFPMWQPTQSFSISAHEQMLGSPEADSATLHGEPWIIVTWVTVRPNQTTQTPNYGRPIFAAVNPLYPTAIANPDWLHSGLNATRWYNDVHHPQPYAAGLYQSIRALDNDQPVTVSAWGVTDAEQTSLRIGLDPTGGTTPSAASVLWSSSAAPTTFTRFSLSAPLPNKTATLFLDAVHTPAKTPSTTVWDSVTVHNGSVTNGGFEDGFTTRNASSIPTTWSAYFTDAVDVRINPDSYQLYAVWSNDGGASWSDPTVVADNRLTSGQRSGAFGAPAQPFLTNATDPPSVSFIYRFETGDPPLHSSQKRFGRLFTINCALPLADCDTAPGTPVQQRRFTQPINAFQFTRDPLHQQRGLLVWSAVQTDQMHRDIFATHLVWR